MARRPRRRGRRRRIDIDELTRLYEEGLSLERLGQQFNVSSATARRRLHAAGVPIRKPGIRTAPSAPETVAALYASGYNMAQIAEQLGVSSATVMRRLRAAGVKSRPTGGRPMVLIDEPWCHEMHQEGHSVPEIADWLGVSPADIRAVLTPKPAPAPEPDPAPEPSADP